MAEIKDAVKKLSKVNQLKRYNDDGYDFRKYLSAMAIRDSLGDEKIEYNSDSDTFKQIFTFLLCQELNAKTASIIKCMKEMCNKECEYINKILSTSGAYISFLDTQQDLPRVLPGRIGADSVFNMVDNQYAFNYFVHNLVDFIAHATTVPLEYGRYLSLPMHTEDMKEILTI